jgi:hypothetical protein
MTLEFICNFMSTAKFIKIGLILFVLASVGYGVSVQNFPQYVETGTSFHSKVRLYFQDFNHYRAVCMPVKISR